MYVQFTVYSQGGKNSGAQRSESSAFYIRFLVFEVESVFTSLTACIQVSLDFTSSGENDQLQIRSMTVSSKHMP